jgi:hypothetical protein
LTYGEFISQLSIARMIAEIMRKITTISNISASSSHRV